MLSGGESKDISGGSGLGINISASGLHPNGDK